MEGPKKSRLSWYNRTGCTWTHGEWGTVSKACVASFRWGPRAERSWYMSPFLTQKLSTSDNHLWMKICFLQGSLSGDTNHCRRTLQPPGEGQRNKLSGVFGGFFCPNVRTFFFSSYKSFAYKLWFLVLCFSVGFLQRCTSASAWVPYVFYLVLFLVWLLCHIMVCLSFIYLILLWFFRCPLVYQGQEECGFRWEEWDRLYSEYTVWKMYILNKNLKNLVRFNITLKGDLIRSD